MRDSRQSATARVGARAAAVRQDAGGVRSRPQSTTPEGRRQGPAHGVVRGGVWRKRVQASKHMLRVPKPGWAVDVSDLEAAERVGVHTLELREVESGTTYTVSLRTLRAKGGPLSRGYGEQWALALSYWRREREPQPGEPVQLGLLGGAL